MDDVIRSERRLVRALLFDLGGVVINFSFEGAFRSWATHAGCDPTLIAERFSLDEFYEQHERGELPSSGYFATLRHSLQIELSDSEFAEGWNDVFLGPVSGMSDVLSIAQRHLPLFALTNSNPSHKDAWETLYKDELRPFRATFVSSDLGMRKPDPEIVRLVANLTRFEPGEILFLDDAPINVAGARTAGMQGEVVGSIHDVRRALSQIGLPVGS